MVLIGERSILVEVPVVVVVVVARRWVVPVVVVGRRVVPIVVRPIVPCVVVGWRPGRRVVERCRVVLVRPPMLLLNRIFGVRPAERRSREEGRFAVERVDLLAFLVLLRQRALLVSVPLISAHDAGLRLLFDCLDAELVHRSLHGVHLGGESSDVIHLVLATSLVTSLASSSS